MGVKDYQEYKLVPKRSPVKFNKVVFESEEEKDSRYKTNGTSFLVKNKLNIKKIAS